MLPLVLRKIARRPVLSAFLAFGLVVAAALISSIPLYTDGVLERFLVRELEDSQASTGLLPGTLHITRSFTPFGSGGVAADAFPLANDHVEKEVVPRIPLPAVVHARRLAIGFLRAEPEVRREDVARPRNPDLLAMDGLQAHATILRGTAYAEAPVDGAFEAIATEQALYELDLKLGETIVVSDTSGRVAEPIRVRVVGTFAPADAADPYWYHTWTATSTPGGVTSSPNMNALFLSPELLDRELIRARGFPFVTAEWYAVFDHRSIHLSRLGALIRELRAQVRPFQAEAATVDLPMLPILERYQARERELRLTLALLESPVLLMLLFYLSMVSRLMVDSERNEIAVLKSRGGSTRQIFTAYGIEGLLYAGAAVALGPPLGLVACRLLGASSGFLELVRRSPLPVLLSSSTYGFAAVGAVLFVIAILLPASRGARATIVLHKRAAGRRRGELAWRRYYLDFLLLLAAAYGYYDFFAQKRILALTGARGSDLPVNPLFFLVSVLFLLGAGLLFVRLFPLLVEVVFRVGRRLWSPALYASFVNVARSVAQEQYVIIFLILTVGIGVFSSGTARSLERSAADRVRYEVGADISLTPFWWTEHSANDVINPDVAAVANAEVPRKEPPFEAFAALPGVEAATKVLRKRDVAAVGPEGEQFKATLLAVDARTYGEAAWSRADLLPFDLTSYLVVLALEPGAVLVSRSVADEHGVVQGDQIRVSLGPDAAMTGTVAAVVDYWPTWNPQLRDSDGNLPALIVADYTYVRTQSPVEPYEIWLRRNPAVPSAALYDALAAGGLRLVRFRDVEQEILTARANPFTQGMNGVLSLGFIVALVVCFCGFLIYWLVSLRSRLLQFGVLRAMGLSRAGLLSLLGWEQLLISASAVTVGVVLGGVTTKLFVPLLQVLTNAADQVPPMLVGILPRDLALVALISCGMIVAALAILGAGASRINVHQALKLGED